MGALAVSRITIAVDGSNADGLLVLSDGALVAVLVNLQEAFYDKDMGRWHLEAGFGRCAGSAPTFETAGAAVNWIAKRLGLDEVCTSPVITGLRHDP